jgi:WhiB family redox-sensing transcriptional regulator
VTLLAVEHPDWMLDAECTREPPEIFYPEPGSRSVTEAKKVCARCIVTAQCLAYALAHGELDYGVWGGLSVTERRELARAPRRGPSAPRRAIRHGTQGGYYTHRRRSETPCLECTDAAKQAHRRRKEQRRSSVAAMELVEPRW